MQEGRVESVAVLKGLHAQIGTADISKLLLEAPHPKMLREALFNALAACLPRSYKPHGVGKRRVLDYLHSASLEKVRHLFHQTIKFQERNIQFHAQWHPRPTRAKSSRLKQKFQDAYAEYLKKQP